MKSNDATYLWRGPEMSNKAASFPVSIALSARFNGA